MKALYQRNIKFNRDFFTCSQCKSRENEADNVETNSSKHDIETNQDELYCDIAYTTESTQIQTDAMEQKHLHEPSSNDITEQLKSNNSLVDHRFKVDVFYRDGQNLEKCFVANAAKRVKNLYLMLLILMMLSKYLRLKSANAKIGERRTQR